MLRHALLYLGDFWLQAYICTTSCSRH